VTGVQTCALPICLLTAISGQRKSFQANRKAKIGLNAGLGDSATRVLMAGPPIVAVMFGGRTPV
jgi:hypothetical protein